MKPLYQGDVLSRGRAQFAISFLLNEVDDLSFFWHKFILLLLCAVKNIRTMNVRKKS